MSFLDFFSVNLVFLLASIERLITFAIKGAKDTKIIAAASPKPGDARPIPKNRFYIDYFYTCGIIYAAICIVLFGWNCFAIWWRMPILRPPDPEAVSEFLSNQQDYYYFLAAAGFTIAFFILPERTRKLADAQPYYVTLSLAWLLIGLIANWLSN